MNRALDLMLLVLVPATLSAQAPPLGDSARARAVINRHIAAVGGDSAIRAVKYRHMVATLSASEGPEIHTETWAAHPNLSRTRTTIPGFGDTEMGFDGTVWWSLSAMTGLTILPEVPKQLPSLADFVAPLQQWQSIAYGGARERNGRKYDVVNAVASDGKKSIMYYHAATGLLAGMDFEGSAPPTGHMSLTFEDYREFEGIRVATTLVSRIGDREIVTRMLSLSHAAIDPAVFQLPKR